MNTPSTPLGAVPCESGARPTAKTLRGPCRSFLEGLLAPRARCGRAALIHRVTPYGLTFSNWCVQKTHGSLSLAREKGGCVVVEQVNDTLNLQTPSIGKVNYAGIGMLHPRQDLSPEPPTLHERFRSFHEGSGADNTEGVSKTRSIQSSTGMERPVPIRVTSKKVPHQIRVQVGPLDSERQRCDESVFSQVVDHDLRDDDDFGVAILFAPICGDRVRCGNCITESAHGVRVLGVKSENDAALLLVNRSVGGEKSEPVSLLFGVDDLEKSFVAGVATTDGATFSSFDAVSLQDTNDLFLAHAFHRSRDIAGRFSVDVPFANDCFCGRINDCHTEIVLYDKSASQVYEVVA